MPGIPTKVSLEILRRVPVDALFQLRSVCKSWCRIINHPKFAKLHFNRGGGNNGWILHRSKCGRLFLLPLHHLVYLPISMPNSTTKVFEYCNCDKSLKQFCSRCFRGCECKCDKALMEVCSECSTGWVDATNVKVLVCPGIPRMRELPLPSCNGLILISSSKPHLVWVIWNPFTGESLKLPPCYEFPNDYRKGYLDIPYSGIGYDEASDDYKVVRIVKSCTFIYSVNAKVWRKTCDFPTDYCIELRTRDGAFVNGALHWVARSLGWIVAFDLSTETYRKIPLPREISNVEMPCDLKLVAWSGFLFLSWCDLSELFEIWMVKDYNGCDDRMWTKMMSLERSGEFAGGHTPIAYLKNENLILIQRRSGMFWWYNVDKKILKEVSIDVNRHANVGGFDNDSFTSQVIPASLVRLQSSDAANGEGKSLKRKRKWSDPEKLGLKILYGEPVKL